jgi:hypothetical protein
MEVAFDPVTEYFSFRHFWVLLPGLPLHLQNEGVMQAIGNSLGKFIMLDRASLSAASRKVGRILVELDIHLRLSESIEIEWRGRRILQCLDYLGIPFRCSICRSTSHLRRDFKGFGVGVDEPEGSDHLIGSPDSSPDISFYGKGPIHLAQDDPSHSELMDSLTVS